jgi:secreted PhoX family phosphatase
VREALAQSTSSSALLGFAPVPLSTDDTVVVPEGYRVQYFIPHGAPLDGSADSAQRMLEASADEQAAMIGTHHDGIHYFPIDGSSTDGLLVLNHEYVDPRFMHTSYIGKPVEGDEVIIENGVRPAAEVLKEIHAHGVSVVRVQGGDDNGQWRVVNDPHNRRIHGLTEMEISGPARGSAHLVTKFSSRRHAHPRHPQQLRPWRDALEHLHGRRGKLGRLFPQWRHGRPEASPAARA